MHDEELKQKIAKRYGVESVKSPVYPMESSKEMNPDEFSSKGFIQESRNLLGIKGLQVKSFYWVRDNLESINNFLKEHEGNIVDIQYQMSGCAIHAEDALLIIYKE